MSERVLMMDCGDAIRRADDGSWGKGLVAKTANFAIKIAQTGTVYSNLGAIAPVVFTLPVHVIDERSERHRADGLGPISRLPGEPGPGRSAIDVPFAT